MDDIEKKLTKIAKALPGKGGWFHDDGYEPFVAIGLKLAAAGVPVAEIKELLQKAYNAAASEFGA